MYRHRERERGTAPLPGREICIDIDRSLSKGRIIAIKMSTAQLYSSRKCQATIDINTGTLDLLISLQSL